MSAVIVVVAVVIAIAAGAVAVWLGLALAGSRRRREAAEQQARDASAAASEQQVRDAARIEEASRALEEAKRSLGDALDDARKERHRRETVEVPLKRARAENAAVRERLDAFGETLLRLERLRRRREWAILAGPSLADPWQGADVEPFAALCASLGTELEAIREEVGTPGVLQAGEGPDLPAAVAALGLRAEVELLRRLAPLCEELEVSVGRGETGLWLRTEAASVSDAAEAGRNVAQLEEALAAAGPLGWTLSSAAGGGSLSVALLIADPEQGQPHSASAEEDRPG